MGLAFDADYYNHLSLEYRARRDLLCSALRDARFNFTVPEGAYYVLADFSPLSDRTDTEFARWLAADIGVATVPGSSFYHKRSAGSTCVRFAFCKRTETLERAGERLAGLAARL